MSKKTEKRCRKIFELKADGAKSVAIVGDFNDWNEKKHVMKKNGNGLWRKTLQLSPGTYEYKFIVDGEWVNDPQNDNHRANSFGSRNNIIQIQ